MLMNKLDIGGNVGIGLGFALMGIFITNVHIFFGTHSILILSIFGTIFSIFGVSGMLISISEGKDLDFFNDLAVAVILFVPIFLFFIFIKIFWLKVIFAVLSSISFIFVGIGIGKTFFREDGSLRMNFRKWPKSILVLLTTLLATISALSSFLEKNGSILDFIKSVFR